MFNLIDLSQSTTRAALKSLFILMQYILNEKQYRLLLGAAALFLGHGGVTFLHELTGASRMRITCGKREIQAPDAHLLGSRIRRSGAGRKKKERHEPKIREALSRLIDRSSYGRPEDEKCRIYAAATLTTMQADLRKQNIDASRETIRRIVKEMGYRKQRNQKSLQLGEPHPKRNEQMLIIAKARNAAVSSAKNPVLSIDTKAKEAIGNFSQKGSEWREESDPRLTIDHDFPHNGKLAPYGIYDVGRNAGAVNLGISCDTSEFAVESLRRWWKQEGQSVYPEADRITLLCDCGGSNSYRGRLWKFELARLAEEINLDIVIHHYPRGTSKHNVIEHKMFNHISRNWQGQPLTDVKTAQEFISNTTTRTGLTIQCWVDTNTYEKGLKVSDEDFDRIHVVHHNELGELNYTIKGFKPMPEMYAA